jgi:replication-associated recombination protein RarA
MQLARKYQPKTISDFAGLHKAKQILTNFVSNPFDTSFVFVGASGTGKTSMALAMVSELRAELHHVPSQQCTVERLKELRARLAYMPKVGCAMHLVLVDEADQMSAAAQLACLSMLDGTDQPENTVFIFTCNATERFEARFLSRNIEINFTSQAMSSEASALLARVWENEANGAQAPNFARIVKEANSNVRAALMELQKALLFS